MGNRWALLSSPGFVGSIALLLLNDHVLKAAWPGVVTGKLSDVAGVAMVAIALTALLGQRTVAAATTAVAFTLLKTVPEVAAWAAPVLGGRTRTDPSDLVALLVLVPVWRWSGSNGAMPSPRWAVPVRVLVVGAAVFATTATSCAEEGVAGFAVAPDGTIIADTYPVHVSRDGGLTWTEGDVDWPGRQASRCFADGVCLDLGQERAGRLSTTDGQLLVGVTADDVTALDALGPPSCSAPVFGDVVVADVDGVEHIVVAMGWLGVLHSERGGRFEWIAVGPWGVQEQQTASRPLGFDVAVAIPDARAGFRLPAALSTILMVTAWLLVPCSIVPLRRLAIRKRRSPTPVAVFTAIAAVAVGLVGAVLLLTMAVFETVPSVRTRVAIVFAVTNLLLVAATWLVQWLVLARPAGLPPPEGDHRVG